MLQEETGKLIQDWLVGRCSNTRTAYKREIGKFFAFTDKAVAEINRLDLDEYMDHLELLRFKASSISQAIYVIRSFWQFLYDEGHVDRAIFRRIRPTKPRDRLSERILSEDEVMKLLNAFRLEEQQCRGKGFGTQDGEGEILDCLLNLERECLSMLDCARGLNKRGYQTRAGHSWNASNVCGVLNAHHSNYDWEALRRNTLLLRVFYYAGSRVGETVALHWRDLQPRGETGQFCFYGKGSQTRSVLLPRKLYGELTEFRNYVLAGDDDPIFPSRNGGAPVNQRYVTRIVKKAAELAGISKQVSPHWLRHCHASHALDHGCPIHILRDTLGHSDVSTTGRYAHARPDATSSIYLPDDDPSPEPESEARTDLPQECAKSFKFHPAAVA